MGRDSYNRFLMDPDLEMRFGDEGPELSEIMAKLEIEDRKEARRILALKISGVKLSLEDQELYDHYKVVQPDIFEGEEV